MIGLSKKNWFLKIAGLVAMLSSSMAMAASQPQIVRTIPNPFPEYAPANFGRNIMAKDNLIITGSMYASPNGINAAGLAHVIDANTGNVLYTLQSPEPTAGGAFGSFAWIGETKIAVYSLRMDDALSTRTYCVYVFDRASGNYVRTILDPQPSHEDFFGYGLAMLGDDIIAGARGNDSSGLDNGIVYLFSGQTGALLKTFHNPQPTGQDNFGYSITAIGSDRIAVSAPGADIAGTDTGAVFVFRASDGQLLHTIVNPNPVVGGNFGFQVRTRGTDLIIGAPGQQEAYVYDGSTGAMLLRLKNPEPRPGGVMGSTVGAIGNNIIVGNPLEPMGNVNWQGRAYLFDGNTGSLIQIYENPSPHSEDRFGIAVAGVQGNAVIAADQESVNGHSHSGLLYIFRAPLTEASDWNLYR